MNSDNLLDLNVSAAFQLTHPLQFQLLDENDRPNIYILDDVNGQKANINLKNVSGHALVFEAPANSTAVPAAGLYHLELRFRPGTLADSSKRGMQLTDSTWKMSAPQDNNDGTVSYYLLSKSTLTLTPGQQTVLHLDNIGAEPAGGGRGTNVLLGYRLKYQGSNAGDPVRGHREQHVSILNHRGKERLPLHVGFLGYNRIQKDGSKADTALTLKLTFEPTDRDTQPSFQLSRGHAGMDDASAFFLNWDVQANNATGNQLKEWALGTEDDLKDVVIEVLDKNGNADPKWEITAEDAGLSPSRKLKLINDLSLSPGDHIRIRISNFQSSLPNGHTHLYLHYQNIPGYWDGTFVCAVERAPLVFKGENVGIGTASPKNKLDVEGAVAIGAAYSGTNTAPANGLIVEGNVGVGTANPSGKLTIQNDAKASLSIQVRQNTKSNGIAFQNSGGAYTWNIFRQDAGDSTAHLVIAGGAVKENINELEQIMRFSSNGNIGIGTAEPKNELDIAGAVAIGSTYSGTNTAPANGLIVEGNMGIGTTTPSAKLEIGAGSSTSPSENGLCIYNSKDTTNQHAIVNVKVAGENAGNPFIAWEVYEKRGWSMGIDNGDDDKLKIAVDWKSLGTNTAMTIDTSGKVGIGTADPSAELDVNGAAKVGDAEDVNGNKLLTLNSARPWEFRQLGTGANTSLELVNVNSAGDVGDKNFVISTKGNVHVANANLLVNRHVVIGTNNSSTGKLVIQTQAGLTGLDLASSDSYAEMRHIRSKLASDKTLYFNFLNENSTIKMYTGGTNPVMTITDGKVQAGAYHHYSDARIKKITGLSDNAHDLQALMAIQITDYRMKDPMKGAEPRKKVIGQQVEEVFPQAVSQITDVIPDIQQMAEVSEGWVLLPASLQAGERVKLIFGESAGVYEVKETSERGFRVDLPADVAQVFVYGREVDDFRLVDYTALSMLHLSATQALIRRIDRLEERLALLESKLLNGKAAIKENGAH